MIDSLQDLYVRLADQANKVGDELTAKERENVDAGSARREIEGILSTMTQHVLPLIRDLQSGPNAERTLGKAYSPEYLDPILRIEAMIDARIDKALGRLTNLKAYKSLASGLAMLPPPPHGRHKIGLQLSDTVGPILPLFVVFSRNELRAVSLIERPGTSLTYDRWNEWNAT